jgi:hypothetical protein
MILNHLPNNENEGGRALRTAHRCEAYAERAAAHLGAEGRIVGRSKDRSSGAYANLQKVPMTGISCSITNYAEFDKIFMAWYVSPYRKEHF